MNLTKRGLAVPAAADRDSKLPARGVAAASGPELGRIPADRPGRQGTPLAKLSFCQCAARAGPAGTSGWQCRPGRRRRPRGLQERGPAACSESLVGPFMIVAAASWPGVGRAQTARPCWPG